MILATTRFILFPVWVWQRLIKLLAIQLRLVRPADIGGTKMWPPILAALIPTGSKSTGQVEDLT